MVPTILNIIAYKRRVTFGPSSWSTLVLSLATGVPASRRHGLMLQAVFGSYAHEGQGVVWMWHCRLFRDPVRRPVKCLSGVHQILNIEIRGRRDCLPMTQTLLSLLCLHFFWDGSVRCALRSEEEHTAHCDGWSSHTFARLDKRRRLDSAGAEVSRNHDTGLSCCSMCADRERSSWHALCDSGRCASDPKIIVSI